MFSSKRNATVVLGARLEMSVWIAPSAHLEARRIDTCDMLTPAGARWQVQGNDNEVKVTDEDGQAVDGVHGHVENGACVLGILSVRKEQLGNWLFSVTVAGAGARYGLVISTNNQVTDLRLPTAVLPLHYEVRLVSDLGYSGHNTRFDGWVKMFTEVAEDTSVLTFHMDEITPAGVPEVQKQQADGSIVNVTVSTVTFDFQRTFVHLELEEGWEVGASYIVRTEFYADISTSARRIAYGRNISYGFYSQICSETNGDPKRCWFTQGGPTFIRTVFPCMDEPSFKATFSLEVGRTEQYHVRSNTPLMDTVPLGVPYFLNNLK